MVRRRRTAAWAALGTSLILFAGGSFAAPRSDPGSGPENNEEERRESAERGAFSYRLHCLNCHGESGRGDGPMVEILRVSPADLTVLAKENGGDYPAERIYRAIDGRDEVRSHGARGMPVWGIGFQDLGRDQDQEEEIRARILDLVAYIESIQVE